MAAFMMTALHRGLPSDMVQVLLISGTGPIHCHLVRGNEDRVFAWHDRALGRSPLVATSASLVYALCTPLLAGYANDYMCALDATNHPQGRFECAPSFPDMREWFEERTKKVLGEAAVLVNTRTYFAHCSPCIADVRSCTSRGEGVQLLPESPALLGARPT